MALNHGIEKEDIGVSGMVKDPIRVGHFVERPANGDEMGEDLVGLVKSMAEEVGVDLGELCSCFMAMEEAENSPFDLTASPAHQSVRSNP